MFSKFQDQLETYIEERDWYRFHHMKNLVMSLNCEAIELHEECLKKSYKDSLLPIKEEIGDCFINLMSIYRILDFKIGDVYKEAHDIEQNAYDALFKENLKMESPDYLVSSLLISTNFLLEAFIWTSEKESMNYKNALPEKLLLTPFTILLALCGLFNFSAQEVMIEKLDKVKAKYSVAITSDLSKLKDMLQSKTSSRADRPIG